jgi:peptidoglycan hydrolase-like protein with peptidoglycan-binding domain
MHFEVICTPADLATGLQGGPTPTSHPVDLAAFLQQTVACSANTFRRGETGACIGVIQRICSTKFAQSISVDGDFGPATEQAVKAVQRQRGVTDDGIVGPQTWAKMME